MKISPYPRKGIRIEKLDAATTKIVVPGKSVVLVLSVASGLFCCLFGFQLFSFWETHDVKSIVDWVSLVLPNLMIGFGGLFACSENLTETIIIKPNELTVWGGMEGFPFPKQFRREKISSIYITDVQSTGFGISRVGGTFIVIKYEGRLYTLAKYLEREEQEKILTLLQPSPPQRVSAPS